MTLRWEIVCKSDNAELWKLDKPAPDGRGVLTFYRGRRFEQAGSERIKMDAEEKFTELEKALQWFERYKE